MNRRFEAVLVIIIAVLLAAMMMKQIRLQFTLASRPMSQEKR